MTPFLTIRQASATYPVYVGRDLLPRVGELVQPRGKVFVITSRALHERFGNIVDGSELVLIEEGETHKTLDTANYSPFALSRASDEFGVSANTGGEQWQDISLQSECVQDSMRSVGSVRQSSVSAPSL